MTEITEEKVVESMTEGSKVHKAHKRRGDAGKGDKPRIGDKERYAENYDRIFRNDDS